MSSSFARSPVACPVRVLYEAQSGLGAHRCTARTSMPETQHGERSGCAREPTAAVRVVGSAHRSNGRNPATLLELSNEHESLLQDLADVLDVVLVVH
jgi:hypothetical protein